MKRLIIMATFAFGVPAFAADDFALTLRYQKDGSTRLTRAETWRAAETAVVVCDTWDKHHCLNAVRRLEEFAPRLNDFLIEARKRGATIVHAPSDCMNAYADHPARRRAIAAPVAKPMPADIQHWCSRIPSEVPARYPIDQSDGGEDDDPKEHAEWAAKLKAMGRNPNMPWKSQSSLIVIDSERDYVSDRGDEVWNVLQHRGIKNVILTGVHTNMCVLGRPFGLRQMVKNGKNTVLVRDMTDSMYNPKRWPFVDHFTGNDLVVSHVERYVCPTITSDQLLGGKPFRSKNDTREKIDVRTIELPKPDRAAFEKQWSPIELPGKWDEATGGAIKEYKGIAWYRCAVRLPKEEIGEKGLTIAQGTQQSLQTWLNGNRLGRSSMGLGFAKREWLAGDEANLIVMRVEHFGDPELDQLPIPPFFVLPDNKLLKLKGKWQFRLGDDPSWSNLPLPPRFGISSDMLFEP